MKLRTKEQYKNMSWWEKLKFNLPSDAKDWHFLIWLIVSVVTIVVTAFLPIILSLTHHNWLYMSMYYIIMIPIFLEICFFGFWFAIFLD